MSKRVRSFAVASGLAMLVSGAAFPIPASALDRDHHFFKKVEGMWTGPGEIVAGKYKGTKFTCNFKGATPDGEIGMSLDGSCRVGVFTQKMSANVVRKGRGYEGVFMDGAAGEGLDIISGNVSGERVVFAINRNALNGAMLARLPDADTMNVTVSVRVNRKLIPVIGMALKRVDEASTTGSLANR